MTTYAWVGRTRNGQIVKGERAAESSEQLSEVLRREQILVTKVGPAARKEERYRRVSAKSLAIFTLGPKAPAMAIAEWSSTL